MIQIYTRWIGKYTDTCCPGNIHWVIVIKTHQNIIDDACKCDVWESTNTKICQLFCKSVSLHMNNKPSEAKQNREAGKKGDTVTVVMDLGNAFGGYARMRHGSYNPLSVFGLGTL